MKWFLYTISVFYIVSGVCFILYTSKSREYTSILVKNIDRRILSVSADLTPTIFSPQRQLKFPFLPQTEKRRFPV